MQLFKIYSNTDPEFDAWPEASPSCEVFKRSNSKTIVNSDAGEPMDVDIMSEVNDQTIIEAGNKDQNNQHTAAAIRGVKRKRHRKIKFSHKKRHTRPPATCKLF